MSRNPEWNCPYREQVTGDAWCDRLADLAARRLGEDEIDFAVIHASPTELNDVADEIHERHPSWPESHCLHVAFCLWRQNRLLGPVEECGTCGGKGEVWGWEGHDCNTEHWYPCPDCGPAKDGEGETEDPDHPRDHGDEAIKETGL